MSLTRVSWAKQACTPLAFVLPITSCGRLHQIDRFIRPLAEVAELIRGVMTGLYATVIPAAE